MYNLRYHIASLVAVFLALAIGIVLGGLVVRQGVFDTQQRALVSSLQSEFNSIKKQNTALKSSLTLEETAVTSPPSAARTSAGPARYKPAHKTSPPNHGRRRQVRGL